MTGWVEQHLGARLEPVAGRREPTGLVELALRRNPRRAQLLVSTVLGKHVPAPPRVVHGAGLELGELVAQRLVDVPGSDVAVLGFAETATGLGHGVAEALGAYYLHSTRRRVGTVMDYADFVEEHSHATGHRLLPADPAAFTGPPVLVLVDDELSTGATARNTLRALHAVAPRTRYVLATLLDTRNEADRAATDACAAELGVSVDVVAVAEATLRLPDGFAARAAAEVERRPGTPGDDADSAPPEPDQPDQPGELVELAAGWPVGTPLGGRHGCGAAQTAAIGVAAARAAGGIEPVGRAVLVLGSEELMYAPVMVARALAERLRPGSDVLVSSTTRSPVLVVDEPGYPIRSGLRFPSHDAADDGPGPRFAYNVAAGRAGTTGPFSDIVLVVDSDADTAALRAGLVQQLRHRCRRLHLLVLPGDAPLPVPLTGPAFGSYAGDEVRWLLTDLSHVTLEAPTEEREAAIQGGGAHYAESLPIEFQPDAAYRALFDRALATSAPRLAAAVGLVTEMVLAERGRGIVLASLARAGTPVGVLMRRWAAWRHGLDIAHYAVSIVRGRGIDTAALRYLATHHDPAAVVFVDGWTGKGAIVGELAAAVSRLNALLGTAFDADLAVLADPGHCARTFGTREDFLVPSACLNSTVSGLVSRTVRNERVLAPGCFDGAKFYRELAADDVSVRFVDAVAGCFPAVADAVDADLPVALAADRTPTWTGWAEVTRLASEYGIDDVTLVKPGVGETTRVLLRRVPWAVLARADAGPELAHVRLLAAQRGVPVHEVPGLGYRCVGLIHPRFTRGATGADGTAARGAR